MADRMLIQYKLTQNWFVIYHYLHLLKLRNNNPLKEHIFHCGKVGNIFSESHFYLVRRQMFAHYLLVRQMNIYRTNYRSWTVSSVPRSPQFLSDYAYLSSIE